MDRRTDPDSSLARTHVTRRELLRLAAVSPLALTISGGASAQIVRAGFGVRSGASAVAARAPLQREPTAARWQPWLVPSTRALRPAPPPSGSSARTRAEIQELLNLQNGRSDTIRALIEFWDPQGGIPRWSQILLEKIKETRTNPVRAARALALFHTAIADATLCAWDAKYAYRRPQPARLQRKLKALTRNDDQLPSYASEHAAVAAAAATVLNWLFPSQTALVHGQRMTFDAIANEAAVSRLWAGANYRSDLEAGMRIGAAVGWMAIQRGSSDGSSAVWDAANQPGRLTGPQYWVPTPPGNLFPPLEPLAGYWDAWLLESPGQFRPPTPPALAGPFPSDRFLAEVMEVKQTVDSASADQLQIAHFWADNPGESFTPPGHWAQIATEQVVVAKLSAPRAARALALIGVGVADSAIACWECKFHYWILRPITAIRTMSGQPFYDPEFLTPVVTPPFPAYTSGHATFSGCSSAVLEHLFPNGKATDAFGHSISFTAAADQAAVSRLYGGIHYRSDNDEGVVCGRQIANLVIRRVRSDGAP